MSRKGAVLSLNIGVTANENWVQGQAYRPLIIIKSCVLLISAPI